MSVWSQAIETRFQVRDLLEATGVSEETLASVMRLLDGKILEVLTPFVHSAVMRASSSDHRTVTWDEMYSMLMQTGFPRGTVMDEDVLAALRRLEAEGERVIQEVDGGILIRVVPIALPIR